MDRIIKIHRILKDVPDAIVDVVLKYAKTPQQLYMESQHFRTVFDLVTYNNQLSYLLEISYTQYSICIPFHNMEQHLANDHIALTNLLNKICDVDAFLNTQEEWMEDVWNLIVNQYHSIMEHKGYIASSIHLDDVMRVYESNDDWCSIDVKFKDHYTMHKKHYEYLKSLTDVDYKKWYTTHTKIRI